MRLPYRKIVRIGAVVSVAALAIAFVGLLPTRASSGHWPVTRWFLDFFKTRSVALYALMAPEPPPLNDLRRIVRGAGYYETGCLSCHGAPGQAPSIVSRSMTPEPPVLAPGMGEWSPEELFHITRHGIKFTGMPAWPALAREDEVWDMVAFLLQLPELDATAYRRLAWGDAAETTLADLEQPSPTAGVVEPGEGGSAVSGESPPSGSGAAAVPADVLADCARCHGRDGSGRLEAFPRLAGQSRAYLAASLDAFAERRRASGVMQPIAAAVPDEVRDRLATYYAALSTGEPADAARDREAIRRGAAIATSGVAGQRVPACVHCHGPGRDPRNPHFPSLAGQPRAYLEQQLRLFRDGERGGTAFAPLMQEIAPNLSDEEIGDVAAWYASLPPETR